MMRKEKRKSAASYLAAAVFLSWYLVQTIDCQRLKKTERIGGQNESKTAAVQEGRIVFGRVFVKGSGFDPEIIDSTKKSSNNSADDVSGYQADFTVFIQSSGNNEQMHDGSRKASWRRMSPSLKCGGDQMRFRAVGPGASQFAVEQGNAPPMPLFKIPPSCGYNMQKSPLGFVMKVPYSGCNIVQEGGNYVLPMRWWGIPVSLWCPKSTAVAQYPQAPHYPLSYPQGPQHPPSYPQHYPQGPQHPPSYPQHYPQGPQHPPSYPQHYPQGPQHPLSYPQHYPQEPQHLLSYPQHYPQGPKQPPSNPQVPQYPSLPLPKETTSAKKPFMPYHPFYPNFPWPYSEPKQPTAAPQTTTPMIKTTKPKRPQPPQYPPYVPVYLPYPFYYPTYPAANFKPAMTKPTTAPTTTAKPDPPPPRPLPHYHPHVHYSQYPYPYLSYDARPYFRP